MISSFCGELKGILWQCKASLSSSRAIILNLYCRSKINRFLTDGLTGDSNFGTTHLLSWLWCLFCFVFACVFFFFPFFLNFFFLFHLCRKLLNKVKKFPGKNASSKGSVFSWERKWPTVLTKEWKPLWQSVLSLQGCDCMKCLTWRTHWVKWYTHKNPLCRHPLAGNCLSTTRRLGHWFVSLSFFGVNAFPVVHLN